MRPDHSVPFADYLPRVRVTHYAPLSGAKIPLTIWVGTIRWGWYGKTLKRGWFWHATWKVTS